VRVIEPSGGGLQYENKLQIGQRPSQLYGSTMVFSFAHIERLILLLRSELASRTKYHYNGTNNQQRRWYDTKEFGTGLRAL
jgi:hypothetical protein